MLVKDIVLEVKCQVKIQLGWIEGGLGARYSVLSVDHIRALGNNDYFMFKLS